VACRGKSGDLLDCKALDESDWGISKPSIYEDSHIYLKPATGTLAAVDWDFEPYPPNK